MGLRTIMAGAALAGALCAAGGAWAEPGGAAPARPARIFDHLTGCWSVEGTVRGRPVTNFAKGRWILDGAYFLLQLKTPPGARPYNAAIFFGRQANGAVLVHWLDALGAEFSQYPGRGTETPTRVVTDFAYPDGPTRNEITLLPGGRWRMLVTETPAGKPTRVFSDYAFQPAACGAADFQL
jgi:hypothetical protein